MTGPLPHDDSVMWPSMVLYLMLVLHSRQYPLNCQPGDRLAIPAKMYGPAPEAAPKNEGVCVRSRKRKVAVLATAQSGTLPVCYGIGPHRRAGLGQLSQGSGERSVSGRLPAYVDTDDDGICDLSQRSATPTTRPSSRHHDHSAGRHLPRTGEPPTGDCPLGPCAGCSACISVGVTAATAIPASHRTTALRRWPAVRTRHHATRPRPRRTVPAVAGRGRPGGNDGRLLLTHYLVSPIAIGFILIYGASFFLYKTKRIRWPPTGRSGTCLLAATFLITGIFGTLLAFQLDYALLFNWPINLLFWHVEAGIVMTFISLFHLGWHFKYYKMILRTPARSGVCSGRRRRSFDLDERPTGPGSPASPPRRARSPQARGEAPGPARPRLSAHAAPRLRSGETVTRRPCDRARRLLDSPCEDRTTYNMSRMSA